MADNQNRIFVNLRVRPRNTREKNSDLMVNYDLQDPKVLNLTSGKTYGFDAVYYDSVTQKNIFNNSIKPVLKNVLSGFQSAILAYGQTGSGKTHTMRGKDHDPELQGVIPRVAHYLYDESINGPVEVKIAYVQLYLGKPRDLLNPDSGVTPEFRIDQEKDELQFHNVTFAEAKTYDHFMKLADGADKHKVVRATAMNPESSRGHSAMLVEVSKSTNEGGISSIQKGKLFLVDLAGYEQAALIGTDGMLQQETKHINETLLGLNRVMSALARKEKHIPYREFKLTMMLKDALSTKTRSLVMLMMSPASEYKQQSMNTLYFGQSAMSVKVKATVVAVTDWKSFAQSLQQLMGAREDRIRTMKTWFEKVSPKEMGLYEDQFGKIAEDEFDEGSTDIEDVIEKFSAVSHDKVSVDDSDDIDVDNLDGVDPNDKDLVKRIEMKLMRRKQRAEKDFDKEITMLKAQHEEEMEQMRKMGKTDEELLALQKEHEFEIKMRSQAHWDSMGYCDEKIEKVKNTVSLRILTKMKRWYRKAQLKLNGGAPSSPRSAMLDAKEKEKALAMLDGALTRTNTFLQQKKVSDQKPVVSKPKDKKMEDLLLNLDGSIKIVDGTQSPKSGGMRRVDSMTQQQGSPLGSPAGLGSRSFRSFRGTDAYKEMSAVKDDPEFQEFCKMYQFFQGMKGQFGSDMQSQAAQARMAQMASGQASPPGARPSASFRATPGSPTASASFRAPGSPTAASFRATPGSPTGMTTTARYATAGAASPTQPASPARVQRAGYSTTTTASFRQSPVQGAPGQPVYR
jgi:hypothetical protein|eukprot:CAMPEP_0174285996 /NCGR_PEP_ID=MMETSP0809-20121228/10303_1 /TAXON_ID=73025 ORGANISM="Eutreptiella gymnastica-like, Strain CCMP1594" /NCGR_SAMPLE_ID=MMETSP0809 /ASSEMBLY_ACC=CAM_ASM_000658 /LENGTH=793 /DNA_ID=CAMNT_0015381909 /DNA_START=32 /DNA_END=2413 /DNA_ORIENTATION=-